MRTKLLKQLRWVRQKSKTRARMQLISGFKKMNSFFWAKTLDNSMFPPILIILKIDMLNNFFLVSKFQIHQNNAKMSSTFFVTCYVQFFGPTCVRMAFSECEQRTTGFNERWTWTLNIFVILITMPQHFSKFVIIRDFGTDLLFTFSICLIKKSLVFVKSTQKCTTRCVNEVNIKNKAWRYLVQKTLDLCMMKNLKSTQTVQRTAVNRLFIFFCEFQLGRKHLTAKRRIFAKFSKEIFHLSLTWS